MRHLFRPEWGRGMMPLLRASFASRDLRQAQDDRRYTSQVWRKRAGSVDLSPSFDARRTGSPPDAAVRIGLLTAQYINK